jgi:4'-phosphopantetheinyl transferase
MPAVDVWCVQEQAVTDGCLNVLGHQEHHRLQSIQHPHTASMYGFSHAFTRVVLSSYEPSISPVQWRWVYGTHGKPYVDMSYHGLEKPLFFNLSHTQGCVVCVVSRDVEVGVDVENISHEHPFEALAQRYFAEAEAEHVASVSVSEKARVFYTYWTLKEAYLKACGMGLTMPLRKCVIPWQEEACWCVLESSAAQGLPGAVLFKSVLGSSHRMAVACVSESSVQMRWMSVF